MSSLIFVIFEKVIKGCFYCRVKRIYARLSGMEKPLSDEAAKGIAQAIKHLLAGDKDEKTPLELLDERIAQLNCDIRAAAENRRLQKQLLLQLKTAMKKREELLKKS